MKARTLRISDNPLDERLLKKLMRLRLADSKDGKPLVAVNGSKRIYAESLKPGYDLTKTKHQREKQGVRS